MATKTPEVGAEVDAYCTKCKTDTGHIIVALSGDEVKRVECQSCGGHHNYRKPKSAAAAAPAAKAKTTKKKAPGEKRTKASAHHVPDLETWDAAIKTGSPKVKRYEQDGVFQAGEIIDHHKFGMGKVEDVLRNKMKVAFREGAKLLLCRDKRG